VRHITAALLVLLILIPYSFAYTAEVENIPPERYLEVTLNEIQQAESSIHLYMYLIALPPNRLSSKVHDLVDALVEAKERGVDVRVVLDRNIDWTEESNLRFWDAAGKNRKAYRYLKEKGVSAFFDDEAVFTHAKVLIIDEKTVILGSANWSEAAFTHNVESNVLIRSEELAGEILEGFETLQLHAPEIGSGDTVSAPRAFLSDPNLLGRMVTDRVEKAFDLYLFLLKSFDGNKEGKVVASYQAMSEGIGWRPKRKYRRRDVIQRALGRLQDRYQLISFTASDNEEAVIYLKGPGDPAGPHQIPGEKAVRVPVTYWEYGWDQELTFPGKVMYLLSLMYSEQSPMAPAWFRSQEDLAQRHGISVGSIKNGVMDLRRHNLIEVRSDLNPDEPKVRKANEYAHNPLYDPKELKRAFGALERRYGKRKVKKATGYAAVVFEDSDVEGVERLILLEEEFGAKVVKKAVGVVKKMHGTNPKRTMGYLIATIQGIGGREGQVRQDGS